MRIKVLFVCLGNICRSPMAEGIFRHKIERLGLKGRVDCDSAGTASYHIGSLPDKRTIQTCMENGIVLTHRARAFTSADFSYFDYIMVMDDANERNVKRLVPNAPKAKVHFMREFDSFLGEPYVPDPYYGEIDGFQLVYEILDRSIDGFIQHIKYQHSLHDVQAL